MNLIMHFVTVDDVVALLGMQVAILVTLAPALLAIMGRGLARYPAFAFNSVVFVLCVPNVGAIVTIACIHAWLIALICALVALQARKQKALRDAADA